MDAPSPPRVAIIGAGPAGLSAAYVLARGGVGGSGVPRLPGIGADIFEASPHVGGLCRSLDLWGQRVDLGPHRFFSQERAVNALWLEVVGRDYEMVPRLTRIHYRGRFFAYPLRITDALRNLGPVEILRCAIDFARERARPTRGGNRDDTFEDWVTARFGRRLYEIFFKTYSEKLWGISCRELSADFAAQRIKQLDLLEVVRAALFGADKKKHRTLVDEFAYPIGGTGTVYQRMAASSVAAGARLHLGAPISEVVVEGGRVTGVILQSGEHRPYDVVISSMPLTRLVRGLAAAPAEVQAAADRLEFRNTLLCYLEVEGSAHFPDNWIYLHSPALRAGRLTNFSNWSRHPRRDRATTVMCLEFWANPDDALWQQSDAELIALGRRELAATGLVGNAACLGGHIIRIPRSYPVYRRGYGDHVGVIRAHLDSIRGLFAIGRYGAFKYNNQDHSLLMGIRVAESILTGTPANLWDINSDDAYQEGAIITASGLADLSGETR